MIGLGYFLVFIIYYILFHALKTTWHNLCALTQLVDASGIIALLGVIVTLSIPIVIFVFNNSFSRQDLDQLHEEQGAKKGLKPQRHTNNFPWERRLLMHDIARPILTLCAILVAAIVYIVWNNVDAEIDVPNQISAVFLLTIYICSVCWIISRLVAFYRWAASEYRIGNDKTYRQRLREQFLKNINKDNVFQIWDETWYYIARQDDYQPDYLKIYFEGFKKIEPNQMWRYRLSLTLPEPNKINFANPKVQQEYVNFFMSVSSQRDITDLDQTKFLFCDDLLQNAIFTKDQLVYGSSRICELVDNKLTVTNIDKIMQPVLTNLFDLIHKNCDFIVENGKLHIIPLHRWQVFDLCEASMNENKLSFKQEKAKFLLGAYCGWFGQLFYSSLDQQDEGARWQKMQLARIVFEAVFGIDINNEKINRELIQIVIIFWPQTIEAKQEKQYIMRRVGDFCEYNKTFLLSTAEFHHDIAIQNSIAIIKHIYPSIAKPSYVDQVLKAIIEHRQNLAKLPKDDEERRKGLRNLEKLETVFKNIEKFNIKQKSKIKNN